MRFASVLLVLFLSACGNAPRAPQSLRLAFNAPPTTLDPRKSGDFISSTLICLIYEGLTRCVPGGGIEPALAEKIELSPDGRIYTFTLRNSQWSDGTPVTAFDFEKSWKKIIDPSFPSLSAYLLFPVKNAERCARGETGIEEVGIKALDQRILRVELERPTPYFLSLTAFPLFLPAPAHLESISGDVCNGPFRIDTHFANSEIRLVKNFGFWNEKEIRLNEIQIQIIPDENTALQMFERGQIDWLGAPLAPLPPDALPSLQGKLRLIPMDASTIVTFNTQTFPFQNPKLRHALSLCLDRKRLVSEVAQGAQIPAARCLPPFLFNAPLKPFFGAPRPELARSLFQEALEELGAAPADLESVTLYYRSTQNDKRLAQTLQREWKEAFGFTVKLEHLDPKTHMDRLHRRDYQIALGSWISQFHDPVNILERYRLPSNQKNFAGWENARFRILLEQAANELDAGKRLEQLAEAEDIFAEELPVLPLYHWTGPSLANPRLKEIATTPSGGVLFERFSF